MNTLLKEFELISLISEDVNELIMSGFIKESAYSSDRNSYKIRSI